MNKKYYLLKYRFLILTGLIFLMLLVTTASAQNSINKSPFFKLLDQQIDKNYIPQQMKMGVDELTVTIPMLYVQLLGSAMRDLKDNLNQYPTSLEKFEDLHKEIISIIPQIANVYNNTNSSKIGYEYNDATTLEDFYYRALEGIYSENFKQRYKELAGKDIAQVNIPFILGPTQPNYIKKAKKDEGIVLLGVKVPPKSAPNGLNGPFVTGLKCPLIHKNYLQIDTNNNPDDRTHIGCFYNHDNDLLYEQIPLVNNFRHGQYFAYSGNFDKIEEGSSQPHRIINHGYYNNAKKDSIWERYSYDRDENQNLLRNRSIYKNDTVQSAEEHFPIESYQSTYVKTRYFYVKGKLSKIIHFYKNEQKESVVTYNPDGTYVIDGCWDKKGIRIPCD